MRINCVNCGHKIELDAAYDDYNGGVKCSTCRGLLMVQTAQGQVKSVMPFSFAQAQAAPMGTHTADGHPIRPGIKAA